VDAEAAALAASIAPTAAPRPRGRPRKAGAASPAPSDAAELPRRRGRPRKVDQAAAETTTTATPAAEPPPPPRAQPRPAAPPARPARERLTVEQIVAVESPREFRVSPRDRVAAYTAEAAGTRQLFTLSLRGGYPLQVTASEKPVSDPQWSPDGRRLAYVRDETIWVVDADGTRHIEVTGHPAGTSTPRWSPDGRRLAFISRRRGWSQVWVVDAPIPRRGRPAARPRPPEPRPVTATGFDVENFEWAPDNARIAVMAQRVPDNLETSQILVVDAATGREEVVAGQSSWDTSARWLPDGGLIYVSDASGWFQVVRRSPDEGEVTVLTGGEREHGEPSAAWGFVPLPSPDGSRFTYPEFRDGYVDLFVGELSGPAKRGRGRPPKTPRPAAGPGVRIQPWDGVWRAVGWLADGAWVAAVGESETRPQDLWLLPVPEVAPSNARARQVTSSMPVVVAPAFAPGRATPGERFTIRARDGLKVEGTLWRPARATGRRGGERVPAVVYPHGGPTAQSLRSWIPFKQLLVREGFAFLDVDFRGSTGRPRNPGRCSRTRAHRRARPQALPARRSPWSGRRDDQRAAPA
jgi:Tol biopolymer transport system component